MLTLLIEYNNGTCQARRHVANSCAVHVFCIRKLCRAWTTGVASRVVHRCLIALTMRTGTLCTRFRPDSPTTRFGLSRCQAHASTGFPSEKELPYLRDGQTTWPGKGEGVWIGAQDSDHPIRTTVGVFKPCDINLSSVVRAPEHDAVGHGTMGRPLTCSWRN